MAHVKWISWRSVLPLLLAAGGVTLWSGRARSERSIEALWEDLEVGSPGSGHVFEPAMVDRLPEPARRYLLHAIAPGTPLAASVSFHMAGSMRLQPGSDLLSVEADQVLAPPRGFIWMARVGDGLFRFRGFDRFGYGQGELRWWAYGLIPMVNQRDDDVRRSAAGRVAGEGILVPSTLLPQFGTRWEAIDDSRALFEMKVGSEPVQVTITVDSVGRLERVQIRRWRGDAGTGLPGFDRFTVDTFENERTVDGYTVPTSFRAGWRLGEPDEFPFFFASIGDIRYR